MKYLSQQPAPPSGFSLRERAFPARQELHTLHCSSSTFMIPPAACLALCCHYSLGRQSKSILFLHEVTRTFSCHSGFPSHRRINLSPLPYSCQRRGILACIIKPNGSCPSGYMLASHRSPVSGEAPPTAAKPVQYHVAKPPPWAGAALGGIGVQEGTLGLRVTGLVSIVHMGPGMENLHTKNYLPLRTCIVLIGSQVT